MGERTGPAQPVIVDPFRRRLPRPSHPLVVTHLWETFTVQTVLRRLAATLSVLLVAGLVSAPTTEADAGCTYDWETCYCKGGLRYRRRCMYGCSGVPNHCYSCTVTGTC